MRPFIDDDFLLRSGAARDLYRQYAQPEPIYDYHCHVPPEQIASNHRFADLAEIWLGGDHYKWRAMRANGVDERLVTGDASPREKFDAWVATVPQTLGNPLYHWSHLELLRYFGIDLLIGPETADVIWARANERLESRETGPHWRSTIMLNARAAIAIETSASTRIPSSAASG